MENDIEKLKESFNQNIEHLNTIPDKEQKRKGLNSLKLKIISALVGIGLTLSFASEMAQSWITKDNSNTKTELADLTQEKTIDASAETTKSTIDFKIYDYVASKGIFSNINMYSNKSESEIKYLGDKKEALKNGFMEYLTSSGINDVEKAREQNIQLLWSEYINAQLSFQKLHASGGMEVIDTFAPLAKKMIDDGLPSFVEQRKDRKLNINEVFQQVKPLLESILSYKKHKSIRDQKDRTDIDEQTIVEMTGFLTKKTSPKINRLLNEMLESQKIYFNKTEPVFEPDKEHETTNTKLMLSKYIRKEQAINVKMDYTQEDIISLAHELGHAATPNTSSIMAEVPAILFELFTDKYMDRHNLGELMPDTTRLKEIYVSRTCFYELNELFKSFAANGILTPNAIKNYKQHTNSWADASGLDKDKMNNTIAANLSNYSLNAVDIAKPLESARYFVGSASAFTILENTNNNPDMDKILQILNRDETSDAEKLEMLGVNQESVINAIRRVVTNIKASLKKQDDKTK